MDDSSREYHTDNHDATKVSHSTSRATLSTRGESGSYCSNATQLKDNPTRAMRLIGSPRGKDPCII